jgi:hypothetical protein
MAYCNASNDGREQLHVVSAMMKFIFELWSAETFMWYDNTLLDFMTRSAVELWYNHTLMGYLYAFFFVVIVSPDVLYRLVPSLIVMWYLNFMTISAVDSSTKLNREEIWYSCAQVFVFIVTFTFTILRPSQSAVVKQQKDLKLERIIGTATRVDE